MARELIKNHNEKMKDKKRKKLCSEMRVKQIRTCVDSGDERTNQQKQTNKQTN